MQYRIVAICKRGGHIDAVQLTDAAGRVIDTWPVSKVVAAIRDGTDEFFTANTVWSPVEIYRDEHIRTATDACEHSDLYSLPKFRCSG